MEYQSKILNIYKILNLIIICDSDIAEHMQY